MKMVSLKDVRCPYCNKKADGNDFGADWRMKDDLGIIEYYTCSKCGKNYYAILRYIVITKDIKDILGE